ncbi:MAG TPA: M15 family metallopeptidase [Steroidobacteraceae bacterium]|jgi:LAS superfamily LD-carboxypeptidase LdcB|nr:M15 family metallopeptidase [Steroidobacteraceae bacterium]
MRENPDFTLDQLTGRCRDHLQDVSDPRCTLHKEVVAPFLAMRAAAAAEGIDLVAFSSFRDFQRQLTIWNEKFRGVRPMQDRAGRALDASGLSSAERVAAILWWSALPGASRHHWGTDFDVMDMATLPEGYRIQVVPAEYQAGGPFERLTSWLDRHMHAFGFFRPYATDRGGVSPEPWHLSYAPVALRAERALSVRGLREVLVASDVEGKEELLASLEENFQRYVVDVDVPPAAAVVSPRLF